MRALIDDVWRDALLDADGSAGVRVEVRALLTLVELDDLYFRPERSLRLLWNYFLEIGPRSLVRKVRSRAGEKLRNEKYLSVGWGTVISAPRGVPHVPGDKVIFIAPADPRCVERLVLDPALVAPARDPADLPISTDALLLADGRGRADLTDVLQLAGHAAESGAEPRHVAAALKAARALIARAGWDTARRLPIRPATDVVQSTAPARPRSDRGRPTATLFGYGNFAKTTILPNIAPHLDVVRVHEVDPTQIPLDRDRYAWDTAAELQDDDESDAVLVAGYHHTHAGIAAEALRRGRYAVVEKPVATTRAQLAELLDAARRHPRFFACFQRRYHQFNRLIRQDLGVGVSDPLSCHCVVYEVPLPRRHWYNWPNSGSRLLSNGCHWADHFLYLNGFAEPRRWDVQAAADGSLNCSVELVNGAFFTMAMTEKGSPRLGVQDYVEFHSRGGTVRVANASRYEADRGGGIVRRARQSRVRCYRDMYGTIGRQIAAGREGDSIASLEVSAGLTLALHEALQASRPAAAAGRAAGTIRLV
jgi:predicted dehydrogenase